MAIRFGSSDPKIWLRFCSHLTLVIISDIRKCVFALVTTPFLTDIRMHNYAVYALLCSLLIGSRCGLPLVSGGECLMAQERQSYEVED